MPSPPWSRVKLRVSRGEVPPFGAVLVMMSARTGQPTGRRYQVIGVRRRALQCLVLPPEAPIEPDTPLWDWWWDSRSKR